LRLKNIKLAKKQQRNEQFQFIGLIIKHMKFKLSFTSLVISTSITTAFLIFSVIIIMPYADSIATVDGISRVSVVYVVVPVMLIDLIYKFIKFFYFEKDINVNFEKSEITSGDEKIRFREIQLLEIGESRTNYKISIVLKSGDVIESNPWYKADINQTKDLIKKKRDLFDFKLNIFKIKPYHYALTASFKR